MTTTSRVERVDLLRSSSWDDLINGADGGLFLSRPWLACLASVFDLEVEAMVERPIDPFGDPPLAGGLPFVHIDDIRGERITMLPFCDLIVPPVTDGEQWRRLVDPLISAGLPISLVAPADAVISGDDRFKAENTSLRQVVRLDATPDELLGRMATQPRRHIRRAESLGIEFRPAESTDHLRAFYELHLRVRKYRHGLLCQPYELFERLWEAFVDRGRGVLLLGFDGDVVAGGCLLLVHGDTLIYKYAASHPAYRSSGVSHGAVAAAMFLGHERGLAQLDLGRSDLDQPGLIDFKRRFGADAFPLSRFSWAPDLHRPPEVSGEMIARLSGLFTSPDVPDAITEQAGDLLYRLFA